MHFKAKRIAYSSADSSRRGKLYVWEGKNTKTSTQVCTQVQIWVLEELLEICARKCARRTEDVMFDFS